MYSTIYMCSALFADQVGTIAKCCKDKTRQELSCNFKDQNNGESLHCSSLVKSSTSYLLLLVLILTLSVTYACCGSPQKKQKKTRAYGEWQGNVVVISWSPASVTDSM